MKDLKMFAFILISTYLVGMLIFYYSIGISAMSEVGGFLKDGASKIEANIPEIDTSIKYGYVDTNKVQAKDPTKSTEKAAMDLLDNITEQISGMTMDDMNDFVDNLPRG